MFLAVKNDYNCDQDFTGYCTYTKRIWWVNYKPSSCKFLVMYVSQKLLKIR